MSLNYVFPSDTCQWIWEKDKGVNDINHYTHFYAHFNVEQLSLSYTSHISCDSQYVLYVNDQFISMGQYADYPEYRVYDTLDISNSVVQGDNYVHILAYYQGRSSSTYRSGKPSLIFDVCDNDSILLESSTDVKSQTAKEYRNGDMEMVTGQLGFAAEYNALLKSDPSQAVNSQNIGSISKKLFSRPIKKLVIGISTPCDIIAQGIYMIPESLKASLTAKKLQNAYMSSKTFFELTGSHIPCPVRADIDKPVTFRAPMKDNEEGMYVVIDMGREECGYLNFTLKAPKGTEVLIGYGEHTDDLRVRSHVGGRCFSFKYTCIGSDEPEHYTHFNKRFGGRYIELFVNASEFTLCSAGVLTSNYPVSDVGQFSSSDSLHNKIYEISLRTLLLSMHEHYEDCPWREQALYTMDSRNQMLCGYYAFGEYDFPRESLRLLALSQRDDGLLELCAPAKISITIPSFSLMWIVELYEYVQYSGDMNFCVEMWPYAVKIIRAFWRNARGRDILDSLRRDGYWNFYEWSDWLSGSGTPDMYKNSRSNDNYDAPLTAFYMIALDAMSSLAAYLKSKITSSTIDFEENYAWFGMISDSLKSSFDDIFWDNEVQCYCSYIINGVKVHYAELTNSLALYAGLVPDNKKERVAALLSGKETIDFALLTDKPESVAFTNFPRVFVPVTLSYAIFKYEALLSLGDTYADYVISDIQDSWGYMLYNKATTFWETIEGPWAFDNAGSLCHGWSAIPVIVYFKYILGISPASYGFTEYNFKPLKTRLLEVSGNVCTVSKKVYKVKITQNSKTINGKEQ